MMMTISSCEEDTASIGKSLTSNADLFTIATDTFDVTTRSLPVDAVISKSTYGYLGRIKDPETSAYITSDFLTQFAILENARDSLFHVKKENIVSRDDNNEIIADSCSLSFVLNGYVGDSLAAMKLTMYELDKPIEEGRKYYTNFDPEAEGYIREGGIKNNIMFSINDLTKNDSIRNARKNSPTITINLSTPYTDKNGKVYNNYGTNDSIRNARKNSPTITINLSTPYTDKNGKVYNNYGTYLMRTYYEHPEYFKNSFTFTKNVCPGFYFKTTDGVGMMAEIYTTRLNVIYDFLDDSETELYYDNVPFYGTEEVLQTTHITNNKEMIDEMAKETKWTYLKTPAGIYTEVELPVDQIKLGHENDTITSAKIVFQKMNDKTELSEVLLKDPTTLLMVEKDSLSNFFENNEIPDNITSYLASLNTKYNSYTFNNISSLINYLYLKKTEGGANFTTEHPNWNKVVLVPVQTTTATKTSYGTTTTTVGAVNNEMSITSSRLVGGPENPRDPIRISIIYNKNK
ncbi:MAG: DUF4270 domain-containing protein [Prevotella sp.]|nr:DUF4270 domain-containing protein [Prevotella sp.]